MSNTVYYIITSVLVCGIILGIALMNRVKTARIGNLISSLTALFAILLVLYKNQLIGDTGIMIALASGAAAGIIFTLKVKMVEMPQAVALLNGFGGFSSMLIAIIIITDKVKLTNIFSLLMAFIALAVGSITFSGSMVAAGKLQKLLPQKSVRFKGQIFATNFILVLTICLIVSICILAYTFGDRADEAVTAFAWACLSLTLILGVIFSIRIGGADMPITISLLNSLSGVAGGIAGIAIGDPLLCAAGGIVGASGIILTQTMCKSMNRSLLNILLGGGISATGCADCSEPINNEENPSEKSENTPLKYAKDIIIVPGYGMALAQAQMLVKELCDRLLGQGARVRFAIHPVAGRMPGHMNVLLCEVGIPYDMLYEIGDINEDFSSCDAVIIIGANDVINPAANTAVDTPIYGMPILNVAEAEQIIICNYDLNPGYAGVENPLYKNPNSRIITGDAKDSIKVLLDELDK